MDPCLASSRRALLIANCLVVTALCVAALIVAAAARGDVFLQGDSLQTSAIVSMPGCTLSDGGANVPAAMIDCASQGYSAAASAAYTASATNAGGAVSVFAESAAGSIGGGAGQAASGSGTAIASITWQMTSSTHYSLAVTQDPTPGGATVVFQTSTGAALPPSGIVAAGFYDLRGDAIAFSLAEDDGGVQTVSVGPLTAAGEVSFAPVGSSSLVRGTVTAGGSAAPGLLVEALVGASIVAATTTGLDGTYLLDGLPGPVEIRVSDPALVLATQQSGVLTPPAVYDVDLAPITTVSTLSTSLLAGLGLLLVGTTLACLPSRGARAR